MVAEEVIQTKKRVRIDEEEETALTKDDVEMNPTVIAPDGGSDDSEMEFEGDENSPPTPNNAKRSAMICTPAAKSLAQTATPVSKLSKDTGEIFSPELLAQYYSRLFPFHLLHSWLSYDPSGDPTQQPPNHPSKPTKKTSNNTAFSHREFSFTIEPSPGDEIYIRYQSFSTVQELTTAVLKRNPRKIDIGAVFSHPPKDHHSYQNAKSDWRSFRPTQRELVFDIDLTDYDGVRNCGCSEARICKVCWKMMDMAVKVMDRGLREDFGFRHVAWFYSGRRGVHAWVCDEGARDLSDEGRSAVANYFEMNLETEKKQNLDLNIPLHPSFQRAYTILEPLFLRDILPASGHGILATPSAWTTLLATLPMPAASSVVESLTRKWESDTTTPLEKWDELKRYLDVLVGKVSKKSKKQSKNMDLVEKQRIELWPIATVFRYTYPRLDINVSRQQNHLLKSPFCVHPKTGRVCVPINPQKVEEFDPFSVPTLPQLMRELDEYNKDCSHEKGSVGSDEQERKKPQWEWEKTSLREPFKCFEKEFLLPLCEELRNGERAKMEDRPGLAGGC